MDTTLFWTKEIIKRPRGVTFFLIVSFNNLEVFYKIKSKLQKEFSSIYLESKPMPKWTVEPSEKLKTKVGEGTKILAFKRRIHRDELPEIKRKCVYIRNKYLLEDPSLRLIPGYLSSHNVIIASVNDDFHRIYLFQGVYAEIVYKFERLQLQFIDTAPEFFAMQDVMYFFSTLRDYHISKELELYK